MRHVSPNAKRSNGESTAHSSAVGTWAGVSASFLTSTIVSIRVGSKLIDRAKTCKRRRQKPDREGGRLDTLEPPSLTVGLPPTPSPAPASRPSAYRGGPR